MIGQVKPIAIRNLVSSSQHNCKAVPGLQPSRVVVNPLRWTKSASKSFSMSASFQPVDAASLGRFDNTLPSRGILFIMCDLFDTDQAVEYMVLY